MKIYVIILTLLISVSLFGKGRPEIGILNLQLKGSSEKGFSLNFKTYYKGIDPELYSDEKIKIFNEEKIIRGELNKSKLTEYDILYSQQNIDIDGDGKFSSEFNLTGKNGKYYIDKNKISEIYKKVGKTRAFRPLSSGGNPNTLTLGKKSRQISIHSFDRNSSVLKMGLLSSSEPFIDRKNSIVIIEIIYPIEYSNYNPSIGGSGKSYSGFIYETDELMENEGPLRRIWKPVSFKTSVGIKKHTINLKKLPPRYKIKATYMFALSESLILFSEKVDYRSK